MSSAGTLTSAVTNTGALTLSGGTLGSTLGNSGTGTVNVTGSTAVTGNVTNTSSSVTAVTIATGVTLTTPLLDHDAGTATINGALSGALNNAAGAVVNVAATGSVSGTSSTSGTLNSDGTLTGTVTINTGGMLSGSGTLGSVIINGGSIAPGNSIGTSNVTGNVDFTGGGNYDVEVNAAGGSDLINATGTATLTSGIVNVQPEAGNYLISTDYKILTAAGGLVGTFASVNSNLAFLDPTLSYDANNVFLKLIRNDVSFASVAGTPNQNAVATVLGDNAVALQELAGDILLLSAADANLAFDSLSGVQHTHSQTLTNKLSQQFSQLLFNRSSQNPNSTLTFNSQNFDPMQGYLLADNSNNWQTTESSSSQYGSVVPERGWWLQGFGGFGDIDDTTNASGADYDTIGLAFGVDTEWRDFVLGVAGSYTSSDVDTFRGNLDIDSFQMAAYSSWQDDAIYVNAAIGFGFHQTDASRVVTVGTTSSTATSDYESYNISAAVETGKDIMLSLTTTLTPYVGIEYSHSTRDDFTETGAGAANLSINDEDQNSLRSQLGLRLSRDITTQQDRHITPYVDVAYVREYMDNVSRMNAGFTTLPTRTFQTDGVDLDRDRLQFGVGISGQLNENTTLNIAYIAELAGSDDNHNISATIRFVW